MKTSYKVILSLTALVAAIIAAKGPPQWPAALARCSLDDPQFNKCLKKITAQGLQKVAKGIPIVGVRPLDPLRNANFTMVTSRGPITLTVDASNVIIDGPSKVQVKKVGFDRKTSTYWIEGVHNFVKLTGNYRVKGNIFVFPIDSTGTFEYELRGGFANHTLKLGSSTRDAGHGEVEFSLKSMKGQKITLKDTKLGPQGSNAVNKLVNDNWGPITQVLWNPMERVIHDLYSTALKPLTRKFTMAEFFPTSLTRRFYAEEETKSAYRPQPNGNQNPVAYSYSVQY